MNDTTKRPRIKLAVDWLKGMKMDIPYSRWVMFALGVYVLACAADRIASAVAALAPILR
jgi:hypothetical protein